MAASSSSCQQFPLNITFCSWHSKFLLCLKMLCNDFFDSFPSWSLVGKCLLISAAKVFITAGYRSEHWSSWIYFRSQRSQRSHYGSEAKPAANSTKVRVGLPDIPFLRYGTSSLLVMTPAMSRWAQWSAVTNSLRKAAAVQAPPELWGHRPVQCHGNQKQAQ